MNIPSINPIRFYRDLPAEQRLNNLGYVQKFQRNDQTVIQIAVGANDVVQSWDMRVFDSEDIPQPILILSQEHVNVVDGYKIIEFTVDFSQFNENLYYLMLTSGAINLYSNYLCVQDIHENTYLLSYSNSDNDQNAAFSTGVIFSLRVEIQGRETPKSFVPKTVESIYSNDMGGYQMLFANPFETYRVNIGGIRGIPDYLMSIVNRALGCDYVLIDNKRITKIEGSAYEPAEADNYPLRSWVLEMSYTDNEEDDLGFDNYLIDTDENYLIDNNNNYLMAG